MKKKLGGNQSLTGFAAEILAKIAKILQNIL